MGRGSLFFFAALFVCGVAGAEGAGALKNNQLGGVFDPHAGGLIPGSGTAAPADRAAAPPKDALAPGVVKIDVGSFSLTAAPDADVRAMKLGGADARMPGTRVFPKITGKLKLANNANSSSVVVTISLGDGVSGSETKGGLFILYRRGDTLIARFLFDVINGRDKPVDIGTVGADGSVTLRREFRLSSELRQRQASGPHRWTGSDWDTERVHATVVGLSEAYHRQYPRER